MKIVHYINNDTKFSIGYMKFMESSMKLHEHAYIVVGGCSASYSSVDAKIIFLKKGTDILTSRAIWKELTECDLFVISGVFHAAHLFALLPQRILNKTYLQFWGGDIYILRKKTTRSKIYGSGLCGLLKEKLHISLELHLIKKAAAVITIIDEDYDALVQITGMKKMHFTARMVGDGSTQSIIHSIESTQKSTQPHLIQIGNSATMENGHQRVIDMLLKYIDEDISIICPLSYGDPDYARQVAEYGRKKFGEKFVPLMNFMPLNQYLELLSKVDVAIFACNRQQAMGNIMALLFLGCKVYLDAETSMWHHFVKKGYKIYDIETIRDLDFKGLVSFSEQVNNHHIYNENARPERAVEEWNAVFKSCH